MVTPTTTDRRRLKRNNARHRTKELSLSKATTASSSDSLRHRSQSHQHDESVEMNAERREERVSSAMNAKRKPRMMPLFSID